MFADMAAIMNGDGSSSTDDLGSATPDSTTAAGLKNNADASRPSAAAATMSTDDLDFGQHHSTTAAAVMSTNNLDSAQHPKPESALQGAEDTFSRNDSGSFTPPNGTLKQKADMDRDGIFSRNDSGNDSGNDASRPSADAAIMGADDSDLGQHPKPAVALQGAEDTGSFTPPNSTTAAVLKNNAAALRPSAAATMNANYSDLE
jgi:hypothetical protein